MMVVFIEEWPFILKFEALMVMAIGKNSTLVGAQEVSFLMEES